MNNLESSYSHYYNKLNNRRGPLWQSRFRSSLIENDETLLHVHRYIHLNPTTAGIVKKPDDWPWSSYDYYTTDNDVFLEHKELSINSNSTYKKFVENQINYQKTIKGIRRKLLE
jgi:putative transposase